MSESERDRWEGLRSVDFGDEAAWERRDFAPTDRQRELYEALRKTPVGGIGLVGYGGAMGGGKTRALAELAIDTALAFPGTRILIARHRYVALRSTTMETFFECCPEALIVERKRAQPATVSLRLPDAPDKPASTIYFRHLTEWAGLGSQEFGAAFIDEAGEVPGHAARMLLTRLRHRAQPRRFFAAASNPWPGWFEQWFHQRKIDSLSLQAAGGRIKFIPAKIADNGHLPEHYAAQQRALLPSDWVDRFIDGDFGAFSGYIYAGFDPALHCWDGDPPRFARYIGGLDFGSPTAHGHCTAGIAAGITEDGGLIRIAEFEERGTDVFDRLERWMTELEGRLGAAIRWRADRSQFGWVEAMRRNRLNVTRSDGGAGSVARGISLVQSRLRPREDGRPGSWYLSSLDKFPQRMREYAWQPPNEHHGFSPQPAKDGDDLMDADRYMHEEAELVAPRRPARKRPPRQVRIAAPRRSGGRAGSISARR